MASLEPRKYRKKFKNHQPTEQAIRSSVSKTRELGGEKKKNLHSSVNEAHNQMTEYMDNGSDPLSSIARSKKRKVAPIGKQTSENEQEADTHSSKQSKQSLDNVVVNANRKSLPDILEHHTSEANISNNGNATEKREKRGIIYLSSIPPFMKPAKLRHIMLQYGEVDRIFLQPEDEKTRKRRIQRGGSKKTNYIEGWVEFKQKKIAKRVALALNGKIVGGKKNSFHHDCMWNMKYLPKFQWYHLTERMEYERASRQYRLKAEMARMQQQTTAYLRQLRDPLLTVTQTHDRLSKAISSGMARGLTTTSSTTQSSRTSSTSQEKPRRPYTFTQRNPITPNEFTEQVGSDNPANSS
eukprot:gene5018-8747_t